MHIQYINRNLHDKFFPVEGIYVGMTNAIDYTNSDSYISPNDIAFIRGKDSCLFLSMIINNPTSIPSKWQEMGFTASISFVDAKNILTTLGFKVSENMTLGNGYNFSIIGVSASNLLKIKINFHSDLKYYPGKDASAFKLDNVEISSSDVTDKAISILKEEEIKRVKELEHIELKKKKEKEEKERQIQEDLQRIEKETKERNEKNQVIMKIENGEKEIIAIEKHYHYCANRYIDAFRWNSRKGYPYRISNFHPHYNIEHLSNAELYLSFDNFVNRNFHYRESPKHFMGNCHGIKYMEDLLSVIDLFLMNVYKIGNWKWKIVNLCIDKDIKKLAKILCEIYDRNFTVVQNVVTSNTEKKSDKSNFLTCWFFLWENISAYFWNNQTVSRIQIYQAHLSTIKKEEYENNRNLIKIQQNNHLLLSNIGIINREINDLSIAIGQNDLDNVKISKKIIKETLEKLSALKEKSVTIQTNIIKKLETIRSYKNDLSCRNGVFKYVKAEYLNRFITLYKKMNENYCSLKSLHENVSLMLEENIKKAIDYDNMPSSTIISINVDRIINKVDAPKCLITIKPDPWMIRMGLPLKIIEQCYWDYSLRTKLYEKYCSLLKNEFSELEAQIIADSRSYSD